MSGFEKTKRNGLTRREALKLIGTASLAGIAGSPIPALAQAQTAGRPNIIFILSDNCRWDAMGFMGHPFIRTPGLDRLAAEGLVFNNAFNTTSLCSPSRASFLTGTYAHTHGVKNNHTPWTGKTPTFFDYLKQADYDTAFIGKWHMPGEGLPEMPSLDLFASYTYREGQGSYFNCPLIVNGKPTPPSSKYITTEVTDRAVEFMKKPHKNPDGSSRPFCLYLSHRTAHPPFSSPKDVAGMYDGKETGLPKTGDAWLQRTNGNVFQGIMLGTYDGQYRKYCEVITAMDRDIVRLLDEIDRLGLREDTVVIYAGDNGMLWGEHRCHGIREPYEESLRIPLIVRAPGIVPDPGTWRDQMFLNIDMAPTMLDLAGLPMPKHMEGISLAPVLKANSAGGRMAWFMEFWKYYPENTPSYVGVRTRTHKYVEFEKTRRPWLFDLKKDPGEMNNLYDDAEAEQILPELKGMLEVLKAGRRL